MNTESLYDSNACASTPPDDVSKNCSTPHKSPHSSSSPKKASKAKAKRPSNASPRNGMRQVEKKSQSRKKAQVKQVDNHAEADVTETNGVVKLKREHDNCSSPHHVSTQQRQDSPIDAKTSPLKVEFLKAEQATNKFEPVSACNTRQDTETSSSKDTDRTSWESCLPTAEITLHERILEWQKKNDESAIASHDSSTEKVGFAIVRQKHNKKAIFDLINGRINATTHDTLFQQLHTSLTPPSQQQHPHPFDVRFPVSSFASFHAMAPPPRPINSYNSYAQVGSPLQSSVFSVLEYSTEHSMPLPHRDNNYRKIFTTSNL